MLFGIKICERDDATKTLGSLSCLFFCIHFGREKKVGSKRNHTTNLKFFKRPFRVDMYHQRSLWPHPMYWKEYSHLSGSEKAGFLDDNAPVVRDNTIKSHFGGSQAPVHSFVDTGIFYVIIDERIFQDNDTNEEATKDRALSVFEDVLDAPEVNDAADIATSRYRIHLNNPAQFYLIAD